MREWPNPQLRRKLERQVASLAAAILTGREELLPSTQRMRTLLWQLRLGDTDADLQAFTAIASETAHLPLGSERRFWDAEALRLKDAEIERAAEWARERGLESCRRLVARFGTEARSAHPESAPAQPDGPAEAVDSIAVVVDPTFGLDLMELVARMPVWIADTPGNAAAIRRARALGRGSLTTFTVDRGAAPEAWVTDIVDVVDLHHGVHSQDPPYERIEVHGARLSESLREVLGELGFRRFEEEPFGFSAALR
jgi:hypothetical protein